MKKLLLVFLLLPVFAQGQFVSFGSAIDSTTFTFSAGDSLTHSIVSVGWPSAFTYDTTSVTIDTSSATLWQIGNTFKSVFSNDTIPSHGIMTDTMNPYPPNANDYFVLEVNFISNFIVDIWHKYQMDSLHAGGIVEFSTDTGTTWMNVVYCNQIYTQNFYLPGDTTISGLPSFTGNSNGEKLSRIQFTNCTAGERTTGTSCYAQFDNPSPIYLRFRFISDSTIDFLSGWMIDSIMIENPGCYYTGSVSKVNNENTLSVFPNPAYNQLNIESSILPITKITITNVLGQTVYIQSANSQLLTVNVANLPSGVYFVQVNLAYRQAGDAEVRKFVKE